MEKQHGKLVEALERVEGFLEANRERMQGVITSKAHENFTASRRRMAEHMTAQNEHTRGIQRTVATKRRLAARVIRAHMRPIAVVARRELPTVGEFAALKLPTRRGAFVTLVAAGQGMARAAKLYEQTFIDAGLPVDFVAQLSAAAEALNQAISAKGQTAAMRVRATGGLRREGRVAGFALRLLDTMVRSAVESNDVLLDEWANVSRIAAAAISPRELTEPPTGPTAPSTPTAVPGTPTSQPLEVPAAA